MAKPRANAISRLLANGGFTRSSANAPAGFTVYQDGDTCKVFKPFDDDRELVLERLRACGYDAQLERTKPACEFIRVRGKA